MTLDAVVSDDGTLIAKAPKSLHGKHIKITIVEKTPKKPSQWENISAVLEKSETLDIPRRTIDDIENFLQTLASSKILRMSLRMPFSLPRLKILRLWMPCMLLWQFTIVVNSL